MKNLLNDQNTSVKTAALSAISEIEKFENKFKTSEILKIAKEMKSQGKTETLKAALNVLKYKRMDSLLKELYIELLNSSDICIFYLSASKLIENEIFYKEIYDSCLFFMNSRPEQLYNLLIFIYSFVDKIEIKILDFYILKSDENFVKELKIKILLKSFKKANTIDQGEIRKIISKTIVKIDEKTNFKILKTILLNAILFDVFIEKFFINFSNEKIIEDLYKNNTNLISEEWKESISNFLYNSVEDP